MWNRPKKNRQEELPLEGLLRAAKRNSALHFVLEHTHVHQIIEDHQLMWLECKTAAERRAVCTRLHRQIARAVGSKLAIETGVHGVLVLVSGDLVKGSLLFMGAALVAYLLRKGS